MVGLAVLVALAAVGGLAYRLGGSGDADAIPSPAPSTEPTETPPTTSEIADAVSASVVVVRSEDGIGTGVVANARGDILTAYHVVDGGSDVRVRFADGTTAPARVASADSSRDIAVLTPRSLPSVLVPVAIGGGVEVGDDVVAIGKPLGLAWSVSKGVVSGLNRTGPARAAPGGRPDPVRRRGEPRQLGWPTGQRPGRCRRHRGRHRADPARQRRRRTFIGIGFAVPIGAALGGRRR